MTGTVRTTSVQGITFEVWNDFITRSTWTRPFDGECWDWGKKELSRSGYVKNDLNIRKRIALLYGLKSFKK